MGGGIAGLSAAWQLATGAGDDTAEVTVYEPGHLGGKLVTTDLCGHLVDEGPDSMLTRVPHALDLCNELGLEDQLAAPQARQAMLYGGGKARPLPDGLVLGAPARVLPMARSGILSAGGMARALGDLFKRRTPTGDDVGVYELVSARFGPEVADRLVEPLLGSIHAGTTHGLSAAAAAPQLIAANRSHRSLLLGLRRMASPPTAKTKAAAARPPLFMAPRDGMESVTDALVAQLSQLGTTFRPLTVSAVQHDQFGVAVEPDGRRYDGLVLAIPAGTAASLLGPLADDGTAAMMAQLEYATVAIATLVVEAEQVPVSQAVSGILVGPENGLLTTACSFGSHKWPHWADAGTEVLRVSVGKAGDETWARLDDEALIGRLCSELVQVMGSSRQLTPRAWRVSRWPSAMPQLKVGHLQRMAAAKAALARNAPRVALAGASYEGAGIPACVGSGRRAAAAVYGAAKARA